MPFASEVDTRVLFVSVVSRVTVAPGITAPCASLTVPRREARYCACAAIEERMMQATIETVRGIEEVDRLIAASQACLEAQFGRITFTKTLGKRFSSNIGAYSTGDFSQSSTLFPRVRCGNTRQRKDFFSSIALTILLG